MKQKENMGAYSLDNCPDCGGDLDSYHRDYPDSDTMNLYLRCESCKSEFVETWQIVQWKRIEKEVI